jgi:hypothetical protein
MPKGQLPPFLANKKDGKDNKKKNEGMMNAIERRLSKKSGKPGDMNGPGDNVHTKKTGKY